MSTPGQVSARHKDARMEGDGDQAQSSRSSLHTGNQKRELPCGGRVAAVRATEPQGSALRHSGSRVVNGSQHSYVWPALWLER